MNRMIVAAVAVALAGPVAAQEWAPHDVALGVAAVALHAIDWGQTRHIARSNEPTYAGPRYVEKGIGTREIIGEQPSRGRVDAFMVASGLIVLGAAHVLPEYRTAILGAFVVTRLFVTVHNHGIGLRIGGSF